MNMRLNLPDPRDLEMEDIPPAIAQLAALQTALAARLMQERPKPGDKEYEEPDVLLTIEEAAATLRVSPKWLYNRSRTLPFVRRVGARQGLRFSQRALQAWIARRRS